MSAEQTKTAHMRKYFSHNVNTVLYVYKYSYKKQDCHLVFVEPLARIHAYTEAKMSEQESKKPSSTGRSEERIRRNHEILGMLKAGVSAHEVAQKFKLSYSGAKKICSKLKLTRDCVWSYDRFWKKTKDDREK